MTLDALRSLPLTALGLLMPLSAAGAVPDAVFSGSLRFESCEGLEEATAPTPDLSFHLVLDSDVLCYGAIDAAGASVTATGGTAPAVDTGLTTMGDDPRISVNGGGQIRYYVAVEPITPVSGIVHVPLAIHAHGSASLARTGARLGFATATLEIGGPEVGISEIASVDLRFVPDPSGVDEFTVDQTIPFPAWPPGSVWSVTITASLSAGANLGDPLIPDTYDGHVFVDPQFSIPAEFPDRNSFRVVQSENLPEPDAGLAGGVALLAFACIGVRRRSRRTRWETLAVRRAAASSGDRGR
jgi:hypothetical protein